MRVVNLFSELLIAANFPEEVVESLPETIESGVYYGWACLDNGPVYKMVMSVGWNPHFNNEKRSMVCLVCVCVHFVYVYVIIILSFGICQETHILHQFPEDFYGSELSVCIAGYVRPEKSFGSLGTV